MSLANIKGGFSKTLKITQNNSNEAICMLKEPFLKSAENWSIQVTDFFINKTPLINPEIGQEQLRFHPYFAFDMSTIYREQDYIFKPVNCYTVCEYFIQLQDFFKRFGKCLKSLRKLYGTL